MQISQKRFEIQALYQLPTNRKWPTAERMMTSSMTSRDLERVGSWSQYLSGLLFRKRDRVWDSVTMGHLKEMESMVSNGLENALRYRLVINYPLIGKDLQQIEWWRHRWRHM